jgi:tetratricopeptide (TPR) repeat protein
VHYLLAMMLTRNGMSTDDEKDLETVKKELNAAIALDPSYADAYNLLGITLTQAGDEKEAIAALTKAVQLSPRNPWYSGNLVSAYLHAQDFEHAIPLLREMQKSSEPQIAARAEQQLQQLEAYQARQRAGSAARVEASAGSEDAEEEDSRPPQPQPPPQRPQVSFMRGTLVSVDCSKPPAATFIVSSGGKQWKLLAPQQRKVVLMGAEEISCSWTNRKVAVNYRRTGNDTGSLVSLELE